MKEGVLNHYHAEALEERRREQLIDWLENQPHVENVRRASHCIDFKIGGYDIWPRYSNDDHLNAINSSSIANNHFGVETVENNEFVTEVKIHLPPAREELQDDIDAVFDLPDGVAVFHGTTALGGMPAPDGVVTPHVLHTEEVTYDTAQTAIGQALDVFERVYDGGAEAIKEKP